MLQVFSQTHERLCLLQGYKALAVKTKLADGDKELSFQYPRNGASAGLLENECYIATKEDEFVLKEIGGGKQWRKYTAVLNLEELKGKSFESFETVEKTVKECMTQALLGTGWKIGICNVTKRRTIRKENVCDVLGIISQCISTYKVEVEYHSREKVIDIYERIGSDKGTYFMEAVNLRKPPTFSASTNGLYTQIRPIGKDGLHINVNGKDYIENHSFSPKNIMLTWKDERYTVPESLAEDAALKLDEMCRPSVTYEVDVIDLANASEEYRDILQYGIGDTVSLIAKTDGIKEKMRITVITKYPEAPESNTCQLSTAKKTFADIQQETKDEAVAEATATAAANTSQRIDSESDITSEEIRLEVAGMKTEIMKDVDDGYLSKDSAGKVADEAAKAAAQETKGYIDKQLESYETAIQIGRDIEAAKKDVMQEVSQNYATTQKLNDAVAAAKEEISSRMADALAEADESKNDFVDADGTVWRMGIEDGLLYLEEMEAEG